MARLNRSPKVQGLFYIVLFVFIFCCNALSLKIADDYNYCFSWADGSRITSLLDIIPSMAAHARSMNGRLVAHAVAQAFLMLPDWIFDIVNTFAFVIQIPLIVRIISGKERNNLLHLAIFCAMWTYELSFGQVNLWLDGACNYLWNISTGLLFIQPFVRYFMNEEQHPVKKPNALFLLFAFIVGAWGESGSAGIIFIAAALMAVCYFWEHKKIPFIYLASLIMAIAGYASMYLAPAQAGKGSALSFISLCGGLFRCLYRLSDIWILVVAFAVLFLWNVRNGTNKKQLVLAGIFFLGSMCAHFLLIFAISYPDRAALGMTVLLIAANAILVQNIFTQGKYRTVAVSLLILLVATTPVLMLRGTYDIYRTYSRQLANENQLVQCAEEGIMDVQLPIVEAKTKYAVAYQHRYLSTEDAATWPNNAMAKYYGVESILGIE